MDGISMDLVGCNGIMEYGSNDAVMGEWWDFWDITPLLMIDT